MKSILLCLFGLTIFIGQPLFAQSGNNGQDDGYSKDSHSVCSGMRTQNQEDWGKNSDKSNCKSYLETNFAKAFPNGVTIGCTTGHKIHFTSATAIENYLPQSGDAKAISSDETDPKNGNESELAGHLLAACLNVGFDKNDDSYCSNKVGLCNLVYKEGTFSGKSVQFVIDEANKVLGGCTSTYNAGDLKDALETFCNNYEHDNSGAGEGAFDSPDNSSLAAISGSSSACLNGSITLSNTTQGGTWYSSDKTIATISASGVLSPIKSGVVVISYSVASKGTVTKSITIKSASTSTTTVNICPGGSYTFNGTTYSVANTYTAHLPNAAGCDSVATLILTVNAPSVTITQSPATCNGYGNPNYNGVITLNSGGYATKFGISSLNASSYNGADYATATTVSSFPTNAKTNVPNTGGSYVIRVYGSDASCYIDKTVTVSEVLCGGQCPNTVFPIGSSLDTLQWLTDGDDLLYMNNFHQPGVSVVGSFPIYTPGNLTIQSQGLTNYPAFCSDLSRDLYIGNIYRSYTVEPLEYLAKTNAGKVGTQGVQIPDGGIGPVRAGMVRYLVDKHFVSTNSTDAGWTTNNAAFAFQIAMWEITHDQYNTGSTNFSVKDASANGFYVDYNSNNSVNQSILDSAEAWVKDIQAKSWDWTSFVPSVWHAVALSTTNSQDLITAEPVSVCSVPTPVSSGGTGGLESKSIGALIGKRNYALYKNGVNGIVEYSAANLITPSKRGAQSTMGITQVSSLAAIMPYKVESDYQEYDQTGAVTDLVNFTNAIDVRAVDFTKDQITRAVAFATKTVGGVYTHTKPICDRLKGAELLSVQAVKIQAYSFVRYKLQQEDGNIEYAISFSAGTKAGRNTYSIQSNWMTQDYLNEDTLVNYQLWASSPANVTTMVKEVLGRLNALMPTEQISTVNDIPATYVTKGNRSGKTLTLAVTNNTANTNGYFELTQRQTENSTSPIVTTVPFSLNANGNSTVKVEVGDTYDADIRMFVNNNLTDLVYMADGIWGNNYNTKTTNLTQFSVSNDDSRTYDNEEYPLLRNVQIAATTPDYVSVYKFLRGGGAAQNLKDYKSIKFTTGINTSGMNLRITLTKQSIAGWDKQYTYLVSGIEDGKTYQLGLNEFKSANGTAPATIDASDITSVVYNIENPTGQTLSFSASINKASFSKTDIVYERTLQVKTVGVSPNPNRGTFQVSFASAKNTSLQLKVIDLSGRVVYSQAVVAVKGSNNVSVQIPNSTLSSMYFVSIEGSDTKYDTQRILVKEK